MLLIFLLFFLVFIVLSGITTIPLLIPLLIVCAIFFRKPWVFFGALGLGLLFDLFLLRPLGQTGLFLVSAVFAVFLYERKFETQTLSFVLLSSFLGSLVYLKVFGYQMIFMQAFVNSLFAILIFRVLVILSKAKDLDSSSLHSSE